MKEFFIILNKQHISPNGYYVLMAMRDKWEVEHINVATELRILRGDGWLDEQSQFTTAALSLFQIVDEWLVHSKTKIESIKQINQIPEFVNAYREMFPKGVLPSGKLARNNVVNLTKAFTWFFRTYPEYQWDAVLYATQEYVKSFEARKYEFMRTSQYFICKDKQSELADHIAKVMSKSERNIETPEEKEYPEMKIF